MHVWRIGDRWSGRVDRRDVTVGLLLLAAVVAITAVSLSVGGTTLVTPGDVLAALTGSPSPITELVILEWRLPRVLYAIVAGGALAVAGSLMQSLTRNPLGSPDIMGFDAGAYTGTLVVTLVLGTPVFWAVAAGAGVGGLGTAAVVLLLVLGRGASGFRLIIAGIGISSMLSSVNAWLLLTNDPQRALGAAAWSAGSLTDVGMQQLLPFTLVIAALLLAAAPLHVRLGQLTLGDDLASSTGVGLVGTRVAVTVVSVGIAAAVAAISGPLTFVALVAPHIARGLLGGRVAAPAVVAAAGAAVLVAADLVAAVLTVSTGLVTLCVGGLYLIVLLVKEGRA